MPVTAEARSRCVIGISKPAPIRVSNSAAPSAKAVSKDAISHPVDRALRLLTEAMSAVGTLWFFALVFLICAEVAAREMFSAPIRGVVEITAYSIVGATFLQLANTVYAERMTRADFLLGYLSRLSPVARQILEIAVSMLGVITFILVLQAGWAKLLRAWNDAEVVGVPGEFSFQVWPLRALLVAGCAVCAAAFAARLWRNWRDLRDSYGTRGVVIGCVALAVMAVLATVAFKSYWDSNPANLSIGIAMLVLMIALVLCGVHIGVAMIIVGFLGLWLLKGRIIFAYTMVGLAGNEYLANYFFSAIPLFVLMGLLVSASDIGRETFAVARWATRRLLAGLGIATVGANAVFAAITGSSIASASVFAKIATPEMMRHHYNRRFAVGVVAGSSVLGMLIPPSLLLIVYGFLSEQSVGHLFVAAILPGIALASVMAIAIWLMARFRPAMVFADDGTQVHNEDVADLDIKRAAIMLAPVMGLIVLVLGGIYGGLYTPTEGGAVGSLGALIYALLRGKLTRQSLWRVLVETGQIATTVLFLVLAANVFTRMLASSGLVQNISLAIGELGLGLTAFLLLYAGLLILLGMVLESVSIMLIVVPLALPAALSLGADPIAFGILTVVAVEVGLLTPPFGLTCYVVAATLKDTGIALVDIFRGALPFVFCMLVVLIAYIALQ